ncbi:MAG: hypothetical protein ABIP14_08135, partial [Blastocatellia bacterium]
MKLPTRFTSAYVRRWVSHRLTLLTVAILCGVGLLTLAGAVKLSTRWRNAERLAKRPAPITHLSQSQPNYKQSDLPDSAVAAVSPAQAPTPSAVFAWKRHIGEEELRGIPATIEIEEEENEDGGRLRQDWFYYQRAYPAKIIPPDAPLRMREQLETEELRLQQARLSAGLEADPQQQLVWAALGPAPIANGQTFTASGSAVSGRVTAITLDPGYNGTTNQTVYVGAAQGGIWRSTDNGANWTPLLDNQPSLAVGAIAIDPTNPNVIYVGTGEGNRSGDSYYGQGLLKSTDGGATWAQITGPVSTTAPGLPAFINCSFMSIEIDPVNPSTLYVATNIGLSGGASGGSGVVGIGNRGIWKSTDGGANWRNLNPGNFDVDRTATDVLVDQRRPQRVFAAILNVGIFRSDQGGEPGTWTKLEGGWPATNTTTPTFTRVELAAGPPIAPSSDSVVYAAFAAPNSDLLG